MAEGWASWELDVLYELVNEPVWLAEAISLLPRRTKNAITTRMSQLRAEAGIVPRPTGPKAMSERNRNRAAAAKASDKLRRALEELEPA